MIKMINVFLVIGALFLIVGLSINVHGKTISDEKDMIYGISFTTDRIVYSVGDPIKMSLKILNYTDEEITLKFNTSQRYEFIIEDRQGNEFWRWSQGRMFTMVTEVEVLGPTNPEMVGTETFSYTLIPGYYKITGIFLSENRPMSGNITIEVR